MNLSNFIWSKERQSRILRHGLFWVATYLIFIMTVLAGYLGMDSIKWSSVQPRFISKFFILLISMAYTYLVVYRLLPYFLRQGKYVPFVLKVTGLTLLAYVLMGASIYFNTQVFQRAAPLAAVWIVTMNFLFLGPPVVCGLFLAAKMLKSFYEKMEEKGALIRENANAELQLLKAQVHPHFLFNTLNNIYSYTIIKSPEAPMLVKKLSDMLRYMTNDCERPLVPLKQELKIISDYIDLEKVRYGSRLRLQVNIKGEAEDQQVAPLLLIPFVENSFKHGTSRMVEQAWISLAVDIKPGTLVFHLENSKPQEVKATNGECGIGLANVQKRLKLLYPQDHWLEIREQEHMFKVSLEFPLHVKHTYSSISAEASLA